MVRLLAPDFVPTSKDVICGRGKQFQHHEGNRLFKELIGEYVDKYLAAQTRPEKTIVIINIVNAVRSQTPNGGFVDRDALSGRWYEIGDSLAREKVGHAMRFFIKSNYNKTESSTSSKNEKHNDNKVIEAKQSSEKKNEPQEASSTTTEASAPNKPKSSKLILSVLESACAAISANTKETEPPKKKQTQDIDNTLDAKLSSVMEAASALTKLGSSSSLSELCNRTKKVIPANNNASYAIAEKKVVSLPKVETLTTIQKRQHRKNANLADKILGRLDNVIKCSKESQANIRQWDREVMGLKAAHSQTMRDTAASRKELLKFSIKEKKRISQKTTTDLLRCCAMINNNQMPIATKLLGSTQASSILTKPSIPTCANLVPSASSSILSLAGKLQAKRKSIDMTSVSNIKQERKRARTDGIQNIVLGNMNSGPPQDEDDPQKQIDRLVMEKKALVSALLESKAKQQQEQQKRITMDRLIKEKAALVSALSKTDAAILNSCSLPSSICQPPTRMTNLSLTQALLAPPQGRPPVAVVGSGIPTLPRLSLLTKHKSGWNPTA